MIYRRGKPTSRSLCPTALLGPLAAILACCSVHADAAEKIVTVSPSASFVCPRDTPAALSDGKEPTDSNDHTIPRFTFWSHTGTTEWVQYEFDQPLEVSNVEVYWFDDRPGGQCRIPESWRLLYNTAYTWMPVDGASKYGVARDEYNQLTFKPVVTTAIRIEVRQQPGKSSGILEWRINGRTHKLGKLGPIGKEAGELLSINYPKTRMVLSTLIDVYGDREPEARQALEELDALAGTLITARAQLGFGESSAGNTLVETSKQMAQIEARFKVDDVLSRLDGEFPRQCLELMIRLDWIQQDSAELQVTGFLPLASVVIGQLGPAGAAFTDRRDKLLASNFQPADSRWTDLYLDACRRRRELRLTPHLKTLQKIVFTKHHDIGGQHYAYTEDVSDSPYNDNNPFPPSGKLCLLEMDGIFGTIRTLIDEPDGLIRDPDVSFDGSRILFAWRKSMTDDDYHLYEMNVADQSIRQLTFGQAVADYEGCYLPNGDLIFNSSRCQQIVDCWWSDVSNLYTCDSQGRYLRRLSFDQVHTNYPTVTPDGRVIYTRWDYNDRGQLFPQPLFQMNPDGTGQTEFYGNNSWFPTTILHARGIPGTQKLLCVLSGHHTYQKGKLAIIDPAKGRQENSGVQLIAPVRETEAVRIDKYGYQGEQFQYPYPLSEREFLVTFSSEGSKQGRSRSEKPFGIYFISIDGDRELLAADPKISCNQAIPLAPRPRPPARPSRVDYRRDTATYFLHDVHAGPGLAGIERGSIKRLRVIGLEFRAAGVGSNNNRGPAGGALVSTPISINGAWDVKRMLGTATVYEDGSAAFTVPARTPVYFQALDENSHAVQSMRSWSTLQPGEVYSCVGCHEHKNTAPPAAGAITQAMKAGPQSLKPFYGPARGFSFAQEVQPILDRHCTTCHNRKTVAEGSGLISLEGTADLDQQSLKHWSDAYKSLADPQYTVWTSPQSAPPMLPPYSAGAAKSPLVELLAEGHEDVELSPEEMDKIACWIDLAVPFAGDYVEAMHEDHVGKYRFWLDRREHWAEKEAESIAEFLKSGAPN